MEDNDPVNEVDPEGLLGAAGVAGAIELFGGGPEDPVADILAGAVLAGAGIYAVCSANHGERNIHGKDPNPWKGWHQDPKDPNKGWKRHPQTGKKIPTPRPPGPRPGNPGGK